MKLAEELRKIANEKRDKEIERKAKAIVENAIAEAKKSAKEGSNYYRLYHDDLGAVDIDKRVRVLLTEEGFTVRISEDTAYTEHAGSRQMYVEISW